MRISDWSSDVCSSDLVVRDVEQAHARAAAADDAHRIEAHANQLRLIGDEHQLMRLGGGKARDDGAVAGDIVDIGDPLTAATGAAILDRKSTRLNSSH